MNHPIVLVHGIAPFDQIYQPFLRPLRDRIFPIGAPDELDYFRGIASHLRAKGFTVFVPQVSFAGSVKDRSEQLADEIRKIVNAPNSSTKVHIIAHSMGGLDARHMIVDIEGMVDHVATLTTIGAPHLGSPAAVEASVNLRELIDLLERKGLDLAGVKDLFPKAAKEFNERAEQTEADDLVDYVVYHSHQDRKRVAGLLQPSWDAVDRVEGANDGLASVKSKSWKPLLIGKGRQKPVQQRRFPVDADHLNELGWWDLNELQGWRWWLNPWLRRDIREFEDKVKTAYLNMAQEAEGLAEQRDKDSATPTPPRTRAESDDAARRSAAST